MQGGRQTPFCSSLSSFWLRLYSPCLYDLRSNRVGRGGQGGSASAKTTPSPPPPLSTRARADPRPPRRLLRLRLPIRGADPGRAARGLAGPRHAYTALVNADEDEPVPAYKNALAAAEDAAIAAERAEMTEYLYVAAIACYGSDCEPREDRDSRCHMSLAFWRRPKARRLAMWLVVLARCRGRGAGRLWLWLGLGLSAGGGAGAAVERGRWASCHCGMAPAEP